eukprot:CAMPEP_0197701272 /NCGR_PEP_ID=MMETSP1338-20131121/123005_1 /TAXON_ID=43686 ORGANISM="Pelagodinium beii, Strain RCC1491" /NCGR_SAMPLE_ID=MMETSP1338 /ASSEMBLY_ACC=CAM_ASM_000754 /LENGTH=57 /DNA_ID=CAMNT_0043284951 /DNA_START=40 /DNA_END=210 /DNA_ORIENTATION=-
MTSRATSLAAGAHGGASQEAFEGGKIRGVLPSLCLGSVLGLGTGLRARRQHKTVMKY